MEQNKLSAAVKKLEDAYGKLFTENLRLQSRIYTLAQEKKIRDKFDEFNKLFAKYNEDRKLYEVEYSADDLVNFDKLNHEFVNNVKNLIEK